MDEFKEGDEVWVKFHMRVTEVTPTQLFGFTNEGKCVSAPIDAVVEKFPRLVKNG